MGRELAQREAEFQQATEAVVGTLRAVTEQTVITMALSYFAGGRTVNKDTFRHFQQQFVLNKYYCSRVSWTRVYNYSLIHSQRDIHAGEEIVVPDLWDI